MPASNLLRRLFAALGRSASCALRSALLALPALAGANPAFAETPASCPPTAYAPSPDEIKALGASARDHGFLWRISRAGHTSYLYGTVHVARVGWTVPGPTIRTALSASDTIALELDAADPDIQHRLADGMRLQPTDAPLPEPLQARLKQRAEAECLPSEVLANLSPEVQIDLLTSLVGRRDGFDPSYGIDGMLGGYAHAAHKAVVSLETPELQFATLKMEAAADTLSFVEQGLSDLESGRAAAELKRIAQIWADADFDALADYESWCDCQHSAFDRAQMTRLLDDRNPGLADAVSALHLKGQRVFAAVGSLHMVGPNGLPALMAARGYTVERVPLSPH